MSFSCPRCLGNMISYPRFADLCLHMEYDHGMWYLGKNSSWPNRWQQLQAEERMLEEELKRSAMEDDPEWSALSSWAGSASEFDSPLMSEQDRRNNMRLKHIEQILGQTKSELDMIKTKIVDRRGEVKNLRRQLQVNNRNTAGVQTRLQLCSEELQNLRGELSLRDKELEEKTREANDLNKFVKDLQLREKRAKQELRIYLDRLFRRIINTENQLRIVKRGLRGHTASQENDSSQPSTSASYPDSGYHHKVVIEECIVHNEASRSSELCGAKRRLNRLNEHVYTQGAYERTMRLVFWYLEIEDLLKCRLVCKEWKKRAQRTEYWTKFLQAISMLCLKTKYILLQGLTGLPVIESEDDVKTKYSKGSLEIGLDSLLQACNKHLLSLSIIDCSNLITDRCLWLAGTNNRNLMKLAYISDCYPAGAESIWSLGAGCRNITTIIVPPIASTESCGTFNNRSLLMIGKCWPELRVLCIGGTNIDLDGLISISVLCPVLEHLELDHVGEVRNPTAEMMTDTGLQHLEAIYFTHTPVSTKALLTFYKKCPKLKTLMIQVSIEDYFQNTSDASSIFEYNNRVGKLKALERHSELTGVLSCEAHLKS